MSPVPLAIALHVGAGALWVLSSLAVAVARRTTRWVVALQMGAALLVIGAGIFLWHARHAGPQGPTEHWLTLGTLAAFLGLGLQIGVAASGPAGQLEARLCGSIWRARCSSAWPRLRCSPLSTPDTPPSSPSAAA